MISIPKSIHPKEESDTPTEKLSKWIIYADQSYCGARSSFINGYAMPALLSASYAIEYYIKAFLAFNSIKWIIGKEGHDLEKLYSLLKSQTGDILDIKDLQWLADVSAYFDVRYPDTLPRSDIVWSFDIFQFDSVVRKIRNCVVKIALENKIELSIDLIALALSDQEIFNQSMTARRGGVSHPAVVVRFNNQVHLFKFFTKNNSKLPIV